MRRYAAKLTVVGLAAVAAACGDALSSLPKTPTGVITLFARGSDTGRTATPEAQFVLTSAPPAIDSRVTFDTCRAGLLLRGGVIGGVENLDAGDSIAFSVAGVSRYLHPEVATGFVSYRLPEDDVGFTPGSEVSFAIPGGAGFPAATIGTISPHAISTMTPIPAVPSLSQPLDVEWSPVGDDSSRVEVSLQYATEGSTEINAAVLCDWRDTGRGVIRAALLSEWATSTMRRIEVTRYRTQRQDLGGRVLFLIATFDTIPPVAGQ